MCPQSKKSSHWRKILVRSHQQKCSRSGSAPCHHQITVIIPQVVLPALVSLNLAQAQLFGSQPARPAFSSNNNQIVDQVLDQLSPSIAQVDSMLTVLEVTQPLTLFRLSPRLSGVWTITAKHPAHPLPQDPWSPRHLRPNTSSSTRSPMTGPRPTSSRRRAGTGWRWWAAMATSTPPGPWLLSGSTNQLLRFTKVGHVTSHCTAHWQKIS